MELYRIFFHFNNNLQNMNNYWAQNWNPMIIFNIHQKHWLSFLFMKTHLMIVLNSNCFYQNLLKCFFSFFIKIQLLSFKCRDTLWSNNKDLRFVEICSVCSVLKFNILSISRALLLFLIKIFDSFYRKIALNFFIYTMRMGSVS